METSNSVPTAIDINPSTVASGTKLQNKNWIRKTKSEKKGKRKEGKISQSEEKVIPLQHETRFGQDNDISNQGNARSDLQGMAANSAGILASNRDRSAIGMFEEGMGSSRDEHSNDSERNRRKAESERLQKIAKNNGYYLEREKVKERGRPPGKSTGESEVVLNKEKGKVYKIKDPYAKSPIKPGVQPEEIIYEHLVHNKYFPETAYRFEGISEDLGEVRIVLQQGFVEAVGMPTQKQIDDALAEKGLYPEDNYYYGNDEIRVTDVTDDNAVLGSDGKVYFIDPIIDFKRPVEEILGTNISEFSQKPGEGGEYGEWEPRRGEVRDSGGSYAGSVKAVVDQSVLDAVAGHGADLTSSTTMGLK